MSETPTDLQWLERARRSAERRGVVSSVALLPPHASTRRYARARIDGGDQIGMLLPAPEAAPDEAGATRVERAADEPFVIVQAWLAARGIRVPALHGVDEEARAIWLEDVGDVDLDAAVSRAGTDRVATYRSVIDVLVRWQESVGDPASAPPMVADRRFDREILRWELDHYLEWRVGAQLGAAPSHALKVAVDEAFDALADGLADMPLRVMHRDFQSHNIMVLPDGELVVLDFQDAMVGPIVYDAVALLRDSYVVLSPAELGQLVSVWADGVSSVVGISPDRLTAWFHAQTVQRKLKDAGRFVFIERVRGNPSFLRYIDDSLAYVRDALPLCPGGERLASLLADLDPAFAGGV